MKYEYKNNFDEITNLEVLKKRVFINSLCFTNSIRHASNEAGVSERTIRIYVKDIFKLEHSEIKEMRESFRKSKIKIKKRFNE